ncbi:DUF4440 domain-containing protein [Fulvivirga ligni]|uniref:DUF4440 domain-containing protein n=1 Tax=Fulvivirga ligni TaxID=2904246 RepID=UPI001F462FB4|nr:DUF4440 domain-containing protein [Fulvivirga ligni]UII19021.1 DUF4440 domain-containing protein [Fulvivirga ligni]
MKKQLLFGLMYTMLSYAALAQESVFPQGEKAPNVHHTGDVWLNHISASDDTFDYNIVLATMAAGARLNWHKHPEGQQLLITKGVGLYQERGKKGQVVYAGDVIKCTPNVEHWHAAAPNSDFAYLAISGTKPTVWTTELTQEEYSAIDIPSEEDLEQKIITLSGQKWKWMANKENDKLEKLFHDKAEFVHMGGSWGKEQELNIIKSGGIWYKKADVHEVRANVIDNTVILLNRITLVAEVGGNEVTNPFEVTEVYVHEGGEWKLGSLSFTNLLTSGDH